MKIIGTAGTNYILEISDREMSRLIGYYYSGEKEYPQLKVGDSINVSEMFMQLYDLKNNEKQCEIVAKELKDIAEKLIAINPVVYLKKDPE